MPGVVAKGYTNLKNELMELVDNDSAPAPEGRSGGMPAIAGQVGSGGSTEPMNQGGSPSDSGGASSDSGGALSGGTEAAGGRPVSGGMDEASSAGASGM